MPNKNKKPKLNTNESPNSKSETTIKSLNTEKAQIQKVPKALI
jgi:hypothetical protein